MEELLKVDTLELEVGYGLVGLVDANQGGDLLDRISAVRRQLATDVGFVMPPVRIRDNMSLGANAYRVRIRGSVVAEGEVLPGKLLAMDSGITTGKVPGTPTREPAFGLDAWWIEPAMKTRAETMNYTVVDPSSVVTTHLAEIVKQHADELLSREEVANLVEQLKQHAPKLVEEVVPEVIGPGELQKVLQTLLRERVPIRDLETIVETLGDWGRRTKDLDVLAEYTRNALRRTITERHAVPVDGANGRRLKLVCVTIDPALEDLVAGYVDRGASGTTLSMPAQTARSIAGRIAGALQDVTRAGHQPVVLCSPQVRAPIHQILSSQVPGAAVLAYNEIVQGVEIESLGLVRAPGDAEESVAAV